MEQMSLNEIRKCFLDFFENKEHYVRESFSLIPENDKSLLLINAGMAPMKNYFMGIETPPKERMATCQKCIRTGDIENVGKTARHATFFEMLGNFSFGDYFKNEAIAWSWDFVTKYLKLPVEKLWVTVYEKDDEAYAIWDKNIGISQQKIVRLGKDDNFWEIGVGPCGPCSEIYYDRGEKYGCGSPDCKPGCECDRYVEFWNLVFTQFDKDEDGNYNSLPKPNIDTGMGLERMACIMQEVDSIFEIDTIKHILNEVVLISGQKYRETEKTDLSIRIITDHIRSVTFMVSDGIMPSNEGRGYVLRRLLRRAARHGKLMGIKGAFLTGLVDRVIDVSGEAYTDLLDRKDYIKKVIAIEEERFQETIDQGSDILKKYMDALKGESKDTLSGENAFRLYDTYGFPLELTKEILEEEKMNVDETAFKVAMEKQRERARSARQNNDGVSWKEDIYAKLDENIKSQFKGYKDYTMSSKIMALVRDGEIIEKAQQGDQITVILDRTPFYPEGGGQVGDIGLFTNEACKIKITNCKKSNNNRILHIGEVVEGAVSVDTTIKASIDVQNRMSIARNHTATHLLQAALRKVVGKHVEQSGSSVTPDRLRFDFSHFEPLTKVELEKVEALVNQKVLESLCVSAEQMGISKAKEKGATALFGEKYGSTVRVVSMGDYSIELCGGTHLNNTSQIGLFKIVSEGGVAAGIRRIEAITGYQAYNYMREQELKINEIAKILKSNSKEVVTKVENLVNELKAAHQEVEKLKNKIASGNIDEILQNAVEIENIKVIKYKLTGLDMDSLRNLGDQLKNKLGSGLVVLGAENDNKVNFIAMATEDMVRKGIHAGNIIKQIAKIAGGGGGGKPTMAQAGAKDVSKIDEALNHVIQVVKEQIK
ncbi:alanine--tRNA ligase [Marinisporobacter balticus]|uniref:Alanine--tRNA ligase n=1 Tax=Marinisporobacter balticus TaxID=2018667 RepID=A0A4R2L0K9_9FIRM|nr:alanine--tRNA ligase [Marinisporobacter balticus]TCO79072.1 alanyl-tRNA synthetase [Marinisporobacter balticus]